MKLLNKFYLDIETDNSQGLGLDPFLTKVVTIQILLPEGKIYLKKDPRDIEDIKPILENGLIVGTNIKFDAKVLEAQFGIQIKNMYDVQIAELVLSGGSKARTKGAVTYKALVKQYCNVEIGKAEQTSFRYGVPLTKSQKDYAYNDVRYLPEIYNKQQEAIKAQGLQAVIKTEMDCLSVMVWLELSGLYLDVNRLKELEKELYKTRANALKAVFDIIGHEINLNSPKQVKKALNDLNIPVENTNKKHLNTFSGYPIIKSIILFKGTDKLFNSFITKLPTKIHSETGRIHADFRQFGARSGRMSCINPNLQQQPSKALENWREVYTAKPGYKIITADYNQMELRILTQASLDPKFIQAFEDNLDLHTLTASLIYKQEIDPDTPEGSKKRSASKKVNFGIPYGVTKYGLRNQLNAEGISTTLEEAASMLKAHREAYPVLHTYLDEMETEAKRNLQVRNLAGRIIKYTDPKITVRMEAEKRERNKDKPCKAQKKPPIPLYQFRKRLYQQIGNNGKNNPIQSLGADILKIALRGVYEKLNDGACDHKTGRMQIYLINVVHDEIVLEVPEEKAEYISKVVKEEMENAGKRFLKIVDCPVKPKITDYWKK